jgi:hypothetical protein
MLEIQRSTIETLVAPRWLRADRRDDVAAIETAFCSFAGRSLEIARKRRGGPLLIKKPEKSSGFLAYSV